MPLFVVERQHPVCMVLALDRKSTRLNSSHSQISYAVFCLKKSGNEVVIGVVAEALMSEENFFAAWGDDAEGGLEDAVGGGIGGVFLIEEETGQAFESPVVRGFPA